MCCLVVVLHVLTHATSTCVALASHCCRRVVFAAADRRVGGRRGPQSPGPRGPWAKAACLSARVTATAREGLCPDPRRRAASCQRSVPRPAFGRRHGIDDPHREPWRRGCVDCQSPAVVALHAAPRWLPHFRVCDCDPLLSGGDSDGHGNGECSQLHATRLRAYSAWTRSKRSRGESKPSALAPRHHARKFD